MKHRNFDPELIAALNDYNENFVGKTVDAAKVQLYNSLMADAVELMEAGDFVRRIEESPPNRRAQTAVIYIDTVSPYVLDEDELAILAKIAQKADFVTAAAFSMSTVRYSVGLRQVWRE